MVRTQLLSLALLITAAPASAQDELGRLVRTITEDGAQIEYYRQDDAAGVSPRTTRICLRNMTAAPKSMVWSAPHWMRDIVAEPRTRLCAVVASSLRIEWVFVSGTKVWADGAMSLGGFGGDQVTFSWDWSREFKVRSCQEQRCGRLVTAAGTTRPDDEAYGSLAFGGLFCALICEARY